MLNALLDAAVKELPKLLSSLLLLFLAWQFGQGLSVRWNIRQKRREYDLATAREFHSLYGEFFATWKLWNYLVRDVGKEHLPGASRWELLKRSCEAEGRFDALLVRLSCDRHLRGEETESLGQYRQLYQSLRQSIKKDRPLGWDTFDHPDYLAFKRLAPEIAALIVVDDSIGVSPATAAAALEAITSNRHEPGRLRG